MKNVITCEVIDEVRITTYSDGSLHFEAVDLSKPTATSKSIWQKLKDWWYSSTVKPYAKTRDLANPFDDRKDLDAECDGKIGYEAGVKISF